MPYKDPKKRQEWQKLYSVTNRILSRKYQEKHRIKILSLLGNKCSKCGIDDFRVLQVDHINGGGSKEVNRSAKSLYDNIVNNPKLFQLLCANCNWIKRFEKNEHRRRL